MIEGTGFADIDVARSSQMGGEVMLANGWMAEARESLEFAGVTGRAWVSKTRPLSSRTFSKVSSARPIAELFDVSHTDTVALEDCNTRRVGDAVVDRDGVDRVRKVVERCDEALESLPTAQRSGDRLRAANKVAARGHKATTFHDPALVQAAGVRRESDFIRTLVADDNPDLAVLAFEEAADDLAASSELDEGLGWSTSQLSMSSTSTCPKSEKSSSSAAVSMRSFLIGNVQPTTKRHEPVTRFKHKTSPWDYAPSGTVPDKNSQAGRQVWASPRSRTSHHTFGWDGTPPTRVHRLVAIVSHEEQVCVGHGDRVR